MCGRQAYNKHMYVQAVSLSARVRTPSEEKNFTVCYNKGLLLGQSPPADPSTLSDEVVAGGGGVGVGWGPRDAYRSAYHCLGRLPLSLSLFARAASHAGPAGRRWWWGRGGSVGASSSAVAVRPCRGGQVGQPGELGLPEYTMQGHRPPTIYPDKVF